MDSYHEILLAKPRRHASGGVAKPRMDRMPFGMRGFQRAAVEWAARLGRAGLYLDTGLGKTLCQLAWIEAIGARSAIVICPLAVAGQTIREARKWGLPEPVLMDRESISGQREMFA